MCGIIGVWSPHTEENLRVLLFGVEYAHRRGPEGKGVGFVNPYRPGAIVSTRANTPREIAEFGSTAKRMAHEIEARMSLGQTRYITDARHGVATLSETERKRFLGQNTQPIHLAYDGLEGIVDQGLGVHNGHIRRKEELRTGVRIPAPSEAVVDSRFLIELYMQHLRDTGDEWRATQGIMEDLLSVDGAASVGFSNGKSLIAWRDARGYRPLWLGEVLGSKVFVSESGFFDEAIAAFGRGAVRQGRQLLPGEMARIMPDGTLETRVLVDAKPTPCLIEDVYLKDASSSDNADAHSIRRMREYIGRDLAEHYHDEIRNIDFVTPVVKSGIIYAEAFAHRSSRPLRSVLRKPMRNYRDRYFLSTKTARVHSFVVDSDEVQGKSIAVIDDSIMRGETVVEVYATLKDAGARKVKIFSAWPPTSFDCDYGVDYKSDELIAHTLVERGIIRQRGFGQPLEYDVDVVNREMSAILRERVRKKYGTRYGTADDLEVYYSPIPLIRRNQTTATACMRCVTGDISEQALVPLRR